MVRTAKALLLGVLAVAGLWLALHIAALLLAGLHDDLGPADAILVLGNKVQTSGVPSRRLLERLETALDLYRRGLAPAVIVSGGLGREGYEEAEVMHAWLEGHGVPASAIIVDDGGVDTYHSALNAREIMAARGMCSVILVSQYYHLLRARLAFSRAGIAQVRTAHAPVHLEVREPYSLLREFAAFYYYLLRPYQERSSGMGLPQVHVIGLGGTISMSSAARLGVVPTLSAADLVAAVPQLAQAADVSAASLRMVAGSGLTIDDLLAVAEEARRQIALGAQGIVVTQGTDTIEEIAFGLDLLVPGDTPIVVTGAMRNPTLPGADGPANLLGAVQVAASPAARGLGALVVFNDEIHAARFVQKTHTQSPATFRSRLAGPIGWLAEGRVRIVTRPLGRQHVDVPSGAPGRSVALVTLALGDDGRLLRAVEGLGYAGLVLEALGGGHALAPLVEPLARLAQAMPVILASRTGCGEVLRCTYGFPGSESDLLAHGLIPAGMLDGAKARLLLTLLLRARATREQVVAAFEAWLDGPAPQ